MGNKLNVLVVGCGNMGASHARAYHKIPDYNIVGLVSRGPARRKELMDQIGPYPGYDDFEEALTATQPDVVSINTYPDTHASYAIKSLEAGAHVFLEKPIALTTEEAQKVVDCAVNNNRKLVIGYILRVHPAWKKFTEMAQSLGKPLVMRMNLNQQSAGKNWLTHKNLMQSMSPIVDCGVHYVDVMCQMTRSKPVSVSAIGAKLTEDVGDDMYNYGQLQVKFADGSVGWYEAGWGPMMSETAYFIKDVIGPKGAVSIVESPKGEDSQDIDGHTQTGCLKIHHGELDNAGEFVKTDEFFDTSDEPTHDELCELEQLFLLDAIQNDRDLSDHMVDAVSSLRIVLAADESYKTGKTINLDY